MRSPVYPDVEMKKKVISRNGVDIEIEYCPKSGGVWLDRGELEKIVNAVETEFVSQAVDYDDDLAPDITSSINSGRQPTAPASKPRHEDGYHQKPRRRESILGEIFDIF